MNRKLARVDADRLHIEANSSSSTRCQYTASDTGSYKAHSPQQPRRPQSPYTGEDPPFGGA
jgi:hypothetical protein